MAQQESQSAGRVPDVLSCAAPHPEHDILAVAAGPRSGLHSALPRVSAAAMIPVTLLTTARFTLRPLQRSDAAALLPTLSDPDLCRYLSHPPFESEEQLWDWLADPAWPGLSWIAVDAADDVVGRFAAVPNPDAATDQGGVFEIGYIVCKHRLREGIARECSKALIEHLWHPTPTRPQARKLTAEVDTRNAPSIHLIEQLGFTREATLREHDATHIGLCDVHWYGLLRSERTKG